MRNTIFTAALLFCAAAIAQKRVEYYPNGNKSFEGKYTLVWKQFDARDYISFDTATAGSQAYNVSHAVEFLDQFNAPDKMFDGKCTFYYDNGNVSYTGKYDNGIKNGLFTYWYYNGGKEAEHTYEKGMASGGWNEWYKNGKLKYRFSYVPFADDVIDTIYYKRRDYANDRRGDYGYKCHQVFPDFISDSVRYHLAYSVYQKFGEIERALYKNTNWNGVFLTCYPNGNKCTEMYYEQNTRVGKWLFYDDTGKVNTELTFVGGKISGGKDFRVPEHPKSYGTDPGVAGGNSIQANLEVAEPVFTYVEQMPSPTVDIGEFISKNMIYPGAAKKNGISGRVIVKFIVHDDGTTTDFQVVRGIGAGCDDEAVRVLQSMPKWKPGRQNGKPVNVWYMQPVNFKLE